MKKRLVLVGGGRTQFERSGSSRAMKDISAVMEEFETRCVWVDEHGLFWLQADRRNFLCTLQANKLIVIDNQQLIIGAEAEYEVVDRLWPLIYGRGYSEVGLLGGLDFGGFDLVGSDSTMSYLTSENDIAKRILPGLDFAEGDEIIFRNEWQQDHLALEEKLLAKLKFPVVLKSQENTQGVSIANNLSNAIFAFFDDYMVEKLYIESRPDGMERLFVGFLGRGNFLPSMVVVESEGGRLLKCSREASYLRQVQNKLIDFLRKYPLLDYGLFEINGHHDSWEVVRIDLHPNISREGIFAKLWQMSGLEYEEMVKKIVKLE